MTAHKLVTGEDAPLSRIEYELWNTYHLATQRFEQQNKKKGKHGRR